MTLPFEIDPNEYSRFFPNYELVSQSELDMHFRSSAYTIWAYVLDHSPFKWEGKTLTDHQVGALKRAAMEQTAYIINNGGDISRYSGVAVDGSVAPIDFSKFELAPKAKLVLERNGFLYRGLL